MKLPYSGTAYYKALVNPNLEHTFLVVISLIINSKVTSEQHC